MTAAYNNPMSLSAEKVAAKEGVSVRRIQRLAKDGRIRGAEFVSGSWVIPASYTIAPPKKRRRLPLKISTT